ncbi:hypothetical protein A9Q74_10555 [Colwellia sp. 39_35_sub15_T18]|nr:hypothetical protein A9Q74_10555 [Colwellia sp. 39_35_sub15_T18]
MIENTIKHNSNYGKIKGVLVWFILFRVTLDVGYILFVSKVYAYDGFVLDINSFKYIESYCIFVLIAVLLPRNGQRPSVILLYIYFIVVLIPQLSFYGLSNNERWMVYVLLLGYATLHIATTMQQYIKIELKTIKNGSNIARYIIYAFTLLFFMHIVISGGYKYFNLDLTKVYEFREDVGKTVYSGIWGYITNWVVKVVNLAMAGWFLYKKNWLAFFVCIGLQVFYFGITSHKSSLFVMMLVPAFYFLFRKKNPIKMLLVSLMILLTIVICFAQFTDNVFLGSLFIRRLFYVPAHLSFVYLDFFSNNPHVFMSNSITSAFIEYPYNVSTAHVVGEYLGKPDMSANNGFIASAYMHFNLYGVVVFSLIVGCVFWLLDSISKRLPVWLCLSVVVGPFMSLFTSSDLGTTLLTHGLLLSLLLLYLQSSQEFLRKRNKNGIN